jgi:S-adenosylmethionine decarboxylase
MKRVRISGEAARIADKATMHSKSGLVQNEKKVDEIKMPTAALSKVPKDQKYSIVSDHFVVEDGVVFAGKHLLIDLWGASHIDDIKYINTTLKKIINECHATLLHIHLHRFTENGGVSGVALLAESHISIHTWPERDYAALDVFMCGEVSPAAAVPILRQAFQPTSLHVEDYKRGVTV